MLHPGFFSFQHSYGGGGEVGIGLSLPKSLVPKLLWLHISICKKKMCGAYTHIINVYLYISCIYELLYNIQLTLKQHRSTYNRFFFSAHSVPPGLASVDSTNHWLKTVFGIRGWERMDVEGWLKLYMDFQLCRLGAPIPHPHIVQGQLYSV